MQDILSLSINNYNLSINIYLLFIIILFLVLIFIILNNKKDIEYQKYQKNIYINKIFLKNKFGDFINKNHIIKKSNNNMYLVENFLNEDYINFLKSQFNNKMFKSLNIFLRKGSGISFNSLHEKNNEYKGFLELFYCNEFTNFLSDLLKKPIQRPPITDNNCCSILIYSNPGDFIGWHKDYSNYYGDRYVVLLTLINNNNKNECCSKNEFMFVDNNNSIQKIKFKSNDLIIFKGSEISHASSAIGDGELRIIVAFTFCDICLIKSDIFMNIYENIKNSFLYNTN